MKEKGEEIKNEPNSENINNISNSTNSSSSIQDNKTPPSIINPELQKIKSSNSKPKVIKFLNKPETSNFSSPIQYLTII